MTQRERLAGLIDETYHHDPWEMADSLLANGVRVIDAAELKEAVRVNVKTARLDYMTWEEPVGDGLWKKTPLVDALVDAVLTTLDKAEYR